MLHGVVFDKDGTLVDFDVTWGPAVTRTLRRTIAGHLDLHEAAAALELDLDAERFSPTSAVVHCANAEVAEILDSWTDGRAFLAELAAEVQHTIEAIPGADGMLRQLQSLRVPMAVATNDDEATSRDQLTALGWGDHFATVIGSDSGFGAKPDPAMVTAALEQLGIAPEHAAMVGDSATDIDAGRAAGCTTVLLASPRPGFAELAARADVVIDDIRDVTTILRPA